jgi:hypothetical protein
MKGTNHLASSRFKGRLRSRHQPRWHDCRKYSGRVGRSAMAKRLDPEAVFLAVQAFVRHRFTDYDDLLNAAGISKKAAVGVDPVLRFVQDGRASRLIVAKDFDAEVSRCIQCSNVSANSNSDCAKCSAADLKKVNLISILPRLVVDHGLPIEVVKGEAAKELARSGGVGAFLRF